MVGYPKQDLPDLVEQVRALYTDQELTEREVGAQIGIGRNVVRRIMHRHGISKRRSWDYDRSGENNSRWRTGNLRYDTIHARVYAARGRPIGCTKCALQDPEARYEWANLTGNYEDVEDYARMCVPCHRCFDRDRRVETGKYTSPFIGGGSETRNEVA